jgi:hypothetical protein
MILNLTLSDTTVTADLGRRKLRGLAVPFNVDASVSTGQKVRFLPGSVDMAGAPVVLHHDETQPIGKVIDATDDATGQTVVASISNITAGDDALVLASVEPTEYTEQDGVMVISASTARHLAVVTTPAFSTARIAEIAAGSGQEAIAEKVASRTESAPAEPEPKKSRKAKTVSDDTETTEAPAVVNAAAPVVTSSPRLPTPGEYLYASINQRNAPDQWARTQAAVQAASPDTLVADVPGLIPVPIVGQVWNRRNATRPWFDALNRGNVSVAGTTFTRPLITDFIADAATATELTDVSDTLTVGNVTFTWSAIKRGFEVSMEAIQYSSPAVLDVLMQDLGNAYDRGCEAVAKAAVEGATYPAASTVLANGTDLVAKLYTGASAIYQDTGGMPDVWLISNSVWAKIGGYSATDGRQLFPYLTPFNASGSDGGVTQFDLNPLGLKVFVSHLAAAGSSYLFNSKAIEAWEGGSAQFSLVSPNVLGYQAGVIGYVTCKPLLTGATTNAGRQFTHA